MYFICLISVYFTLTFGVWCLLNTPARPSVVTSTLQATCRDAHSRLYIKSHTQSVGMWLFVTAGANFLWEKAEGNKRHLNKGLITVAESSTHAIKMQSKHPDESLFISVNHFFPPFAFRGSGLNELVTFSYHVTVKIYFFSSRDDGLFIIFFYRLNVIFSRFDEVQRSGNMVSSSGSGEFSCCVSWSNAFLFYLHHGNSFTFIQHRNWRRLYFGCFSFSTGGGAALGWTILWESCPVTASKDKQADRRSCVCQMFGVYNHWEGGVDEYDGQLVLGGHMYGKFPAERREQSQAHICHTAGDCVHKRTHHILPGTRTQPNLLASCSVDLWSGK